MYCSSCGVAVTAALTYCNYCGERLSGAKRDSCIKSSEVRRETLVAAMVFTFVFGLGAIVVLMGVMSAVLRLGGRLILVVVLLSCLVLSAAEGDVMRLSVHRSCGA